MTTWCSRRRWNECRAPWEAPGIFSAANELTILSCIFIPRAPHVFRRDVKTFISANLHRSVEIHTRLWEPEALKIPAAAAGRFPGAKTPTKLARPSLLLTLGRG